MSTTSESRPVINVTPLIDVLLVLLIIFMVAAPVKPYRFKGAVPSESRNDHAPRPNPKTLVVTVEKDETLKLNKEADLGTIDQPEAMVARLKNIFDERAAGGVLAETKWTDTENGDEKAEKIEKTVFIKAPRSLKYLAVAKLVDALKGAGAAPISFQLDDLE